MKLIYVATLNAIAFIFLVVDVYGQSNTYPWKEVGNIGIGTNAPAYNLDVRGNISNGGSDFILGRFDGRGQGSLLKNRALVHETSDQLMINYGGDFEGGVVIQGFKTTVEGSLVINKSLSAGGPDLVLGQYDGRPQGSLTGNRALVHAGSDQLFINYGGDFEGGIRLMGSKASFDGNVGIGTTNPGSFKLAVEGKIGAREIQVTSVSPWPDFVFLKDYRLRPLYEIEAFVNENGHLPEIPSAKEVEENGINLGDMDAKLLQKIEELTLYVIEQNKRIEKLENENALLKQ